VEQLGIWKTFFSSLPWQGLVPDQDHSVLTGGYGTYGDVDTRVSESDYGTAARMPDGSIAVVYIPSARTIIVNMASLRGAAKARWFDPSTGSYQDAANGPVANSGSHEFSPPGKNHAGDGDWVLLLQASPQ
jgi:Putative collagen-binding domain of a collagenase